VDDPTDDEDTDRRQHPTAAELRRHRRTVPGGIAAVELELPAEPVEPGWAWPAAADPVDAEVLRRGGRDPSEPAMPAEISAIVRQLEERLRDGFRAMILQAPRDAATSKRLDAIESRLGPLEKDFEPHRRFGKWVAGIAATALVAVGVFLYHRGRDEQHVTDELQRLGRLVDKLESKIEQQTGPRP
jgi:hypothetical protein